MYMRLRVALHKEIGETPLVAIEKWKAVHPKYASVKAAYAGRLDPMASGVMIVLLGDECKQLRKYTNLDKEYEIEVLLDVGSDTRDVLGVPTYIQSETVVHDRLLKEFLAEERGTHVRAYPPYSSKTVNGKPLFLYALEGTLGTIDIPTHNEHIYRITSRGSYMISHEALQSRIDESLSRAPRTNEPSKKLGENFRIDKIRAEWASVFGQMPERDFQVVRLSIVCASGTYMRSLAERMGSAFGTRALSLSITRTKIGTFVPVFNTGFWTRTYP